MATIDGLVRPAEPSDETCEPALVRPTDVTSRPVVRCVGHIDRRSERVSDNFAGVIKMMAIKVRFLRHVGDHQNPVDFANLVASILTS